MQGSDQADSPGQKLKKRQLTENHSEFLAGASISTTKRDSRLRSDLSGQATRAGCERISGSRTLDEADARKGRSLGGDGTSGRIPKVSGRL